MTDARRCARCGGSLQGLRRDAVYCGPSCRTLDYRKRREARLVAAAIAATESRLLSGARPLVPDED